MAGGAEAVGESLEQGGFGGLAEALEGVVEVGGFDEVEVAGMADEALGVGLEGLAEGVEDGDEAFLAEGFEDQGAAVHREVVGQEMGQFGAHCEAGERDEGDTHGLGLLGEEGEDAILVLMVAGFEGVEDGDGAGVLGGGHFGEIADEGGILLLGDFAVVKELPGQFDFVGDIEGREGGGGGGSAGGAASAPRK